MFKSFRSQDRVEKASRLKKSTPVPKSNNIRSDAQKVSKLQQSLEESTPNKRNLNSPIVTLAVGREGRLFAAHEEVLAQSPFFERACRDQYLRSQSKRISLPDEEPEIFSAVLEYLYKGDYYPRLLHNKHRNTWELEDTNTAAGRSPNPSSENGGGRGAAEATIYISSVGQPLLRDTVVYCAADRYGLEELKRLSLRKQGLQSGIDVATILRSAQYAYDNTPDSDSRLRAHYLALIIRCRKTFKRSGTMQAEMEKGGKLFFDLFVAMCNHLDDVVDMSNARTPKTV
ncbi:BTB/POZ-like protein [Apiospora hydei]|uniref:BTB/POZ-like protein n=2 Tax=Apiospora TaxID=1811811 RepID=A0ABR1UWN2_9PEZI